MREEELVEECRTLLLTVSLQVENDDGWTWILDPLVGYTVEGLTGLSLMVRPSTLVFL